MKPERLALLALIAVASLSLLLFVDPYFQSMWDAVLYALTSRSLLAGDGYAVFGEPFTLRPPGFTLLLVPVMALFGTDNWLALNLFTSFLGIVAIALLFVYLRPRLGTTLTFALCLGLWISPQYQSLCQVTLSDTAGLAALIGCLLLDRRARATGNWTWDLGLAFAIGAAVYLRTVCLLLVPAIVLSRLVAGWRARERSDRSSGLLRLAAIVAIPLALQLPWSLWKSAHPSVYPTQQWGIYSYSVAQWHVDPTDPESRRLGKLEVLSRAPVRVEQCLTALGSRLPKYDPPGPLLVPEAKAQRAANKKPGGLVIGVLGVLCLLGIGLRRWDAGDIFALGNLAVLSIYFDYDERIVLPSYIFVLASTLQVAQGLLRRRLSEGRAAAVVAAAFMVVALADAFPRYDRGFVERRNRVHEQVADYLEETYSDDVSIGASLGHRLAVFLDRPIHFFDVAVASRGREGFWRLVARHEIQVVVHTGEDNYRLRTPLDAALAQERLVHEIEGVRIYEIGPAR